MPILPPRARKRQGLIFWNLLIQLAYWVTPRRSFDDLGVRALALLFVLSPYVVGLFTYGTGSSAGRTEQADARPERKLLWPFRVSTGTIHHRWTHSNTLDPREAIMTRLLAVALFALGILPGLSPAVEIKNIRPCFGPFGATRFEAKCLPGDVLFMTYDIDSLVIDPKTGKARYSTTLELLDARETSIFKSPTEYEVVPALGGTIMRGDLHVIMGAKQAPGKYSIRFTVRDKNGKAENDKVFKYDFEVVKEAFGFVGVSAPAVGLVGQPYVTGFGLVNLKLDAKGKPDVEMTVRVLDDKGKQVSDQKVIFPRDLPEKTDLKEANFVEWAHPLFLNRAGRFTIEIKAQDKNSGAKAEFSYPLTVIDAGAVAK
jgi:hypothetical protein